MRFLLPQLPMAFDKLFCQALLDSQHISSLQPSRVQAGFLSPDSQTRDRMAATLAQSISVWSDSKAVRADESAGTNSFLILVHNPSQVISRLTG
ncbi:Hypothetical protein NTJ_05318 [Nesidiocoris tenuis]|uniref:Uncharacterized protein n=1 Tax=Nesidiocoris tenuis TaxID=355587 RepID=A0ABN7AM58_9HEMI|nr:Hypothetical protein NTJ_05318 [Nesidiocoris tenuis]